MPADTGARPDNDRRCRGHDRRADVADRLLAGDVADIDKGIDPLGNPRPAGHAQQRIARRLDEVAVIGVGTIRHPLDIRRDMQRIAADPRLGPVNMLGHHRQAVIAELAVVPEAKVAVGINLPQSQPVGRRDFQCRLDP